MKRRAAASRAAAERAIASDGTAARVEAANRELRTTDFTLRLRAVASAGGFAETPAAIAQRLLARTMPMEGVTVAHVDRVGLVAVPDPEHVASLLAARRVQRR